MTEAVEAANVRLVGIEREALRLVEQGRGAEALAILVSPAYEKEKAAYSAGIKAVEGAVRDQSQGSAPPSTRGSYAAGQIALASFCVLLIAWLYLLIQVRRHVARREAAERAPQSGARQTRAPGRRANARVDGFQPPADAGSRGTGARRPHAARKKRRNSNARTRSWNASLTSPPTIFRNRCAWWRVIRAFWPTATATNWIRTRRIS
ncbi:MAG: hypothetical protein M5R36_11530 [Deltaproteobacteria bacterium]|nr:hypothetical protein [Deltaproteobacteria bacterium]